MRYATVCSGIEAPSVAWSLLGWKAQWFSEIEPFPCAVLAHHYPSVPNLGDMTRLPNDLKSIELLCGGTPCQSFSVAGKRAGLDDARGNLALEFCRLAERLSPRWVVWENVPGALSSNGGRDFGAILGMLVEIGYGVCYRVLDAQYFGVPQSRRRVFVAGYLGDWRPPAAVLLQPESLCGGSAPSKRKGAADLGTAALDVAGNDGAVPRLTPLIAACLTAQNGLTPQKAGKAVGVVNPIYQNGRVRKLTPREFERLQGFPDDYTLIPLPLKSRQQRVRWPSDAERYKAIGNSMAVPVMRWIGERIQAVDSIKERVSETRN
jgi:DNA (cytosine-5)-methyltransferase 1